MVRDADGTAVGTGSLDKGVLGGAERLAPIGSPCAFDFTIKDVPAVSGFYAVQVAGQPEQTYPAGKGSNRASHQP